MPSITPLARTGPVTARPAAAILSWPIFSSSVIAARSVSILVIGAAHDRARARIRFPPCRFRFLKPHAMMARPKWNQVQMGAQTKKPSPPQGDAAASGQRLAPQLRMMVKTFWYSPGRNKLFLLGIAVCAVVALTAFGQIKLNAWNKPFYDALSLKDFWGLYQLVVFGVIAGALLALNVAQAWL